MSSLNKLLRGRRLFTILRNNKKKDPMAPITRADDKRVKREISTHAVHVPELRTSDKMVAAAKARAMQGAKNEFAKLMEELNNSADANVE